MKVKIIRNEKTDPDGIPYYNQFYGQVFKTNTTKKELEKNGAVELPIPSVDGTSIRTMWLRHEIEIVKE